MTSVYDEPVGDASYNLEYSIWSNGWDKDNQTYWFSTMLELVRRRAKMSIQSPDKYADDLEDE